MAGKKEESAPVKQARRLKSIQKKLDRIQKRIDLDTVAVTVAPQSINYAHVGSSAHVEELLDQIIEFLGVK